MSKDLIKSRFAPSPTGDMHPGNLRTALFNWLYAQKHHGVFLLRIEDTDQARGSEASLQGLLQVLTTLNLGWGEGPEADKGNGPYKQSERADIYKQYYDKLIDLGRAYPCYCSDTELAIARKTQLAQGHAPKYSGKCRELNDAARAALAAEGRVPTLRFKIQPEDNISFQDLVKGEQVFKGSDLGDFIIRREDLSATFLFCNAIDDSLMGVTHALRGDDHLSNTPRQLLILNALGLRTPHYGHVPLILGDDGAPLSKRNGSMSVENLLEQGFFPIVILNYLGRLGHHIEAQTLLTLDELAAQFELTHIARSAARFDKAQLLHWQKMAVQQASLAEIEKWLDGKIDSAWGVQEKDKAKLIELVRQNGVLYQDVAVLMSALFGEVQHEPEAVTVLQQTEVGFYKAAEESLVHFPDWKAMTQFIKDKTGKNGKALFAPLRAALMGALHGPEMAELIQIMGKERVTARFQAAQQR